MNRQDQGIIVGFASAILGGVFGYGLYGMRYSQPTAKALEDPASGLHFIVTTYPLKGPDILVENPKKDGEYLDLQTYLAGIPNTQDRIITEASLDKVVQAEQLKKHRLKRS